MVDTRLDARGDYHPDDSYALRLYYRNGGAATAQILEVVAEGGTVGVDLDINATRTHDGGLGSIRAACTCRRATPMTAA